jgi:hypothetical protein
MQFLHRRFHKGRSDAQRNRTSLGINPKSPRRISPTPDATDLPTHDVWRIPAKNMTVEPRRYAQGSDGLAAPDSVVNRPTATPLDRLERAAGRQFAP